MHIYTLSVKAMALLKIMQILMNGLENVEEKKKVVLVFIISFQMFPDTFLQTL